MSTAQVSAQVCVRREGSRSQRRESQPRRRAQSRAQKASTPAAPLTNHLPEWSATTLHSSKGAVLREGAPEHNMLNSMQTGRLGLVSSVAFWVILGKELNFWVSVSLCG